MFASKRKSTVIAEGLKIIGNVSADGTVEVNGQVDGDLHCTSLIVSPKALISGGIKARSVVVNGKVDGPISGEDVILKSHAFVNGDIQAQSLSIERGAHFDGRSLRPEVTNLRQVEEPAPNGQLEKEAEPKTKVEEPAPNGLLERVRPALFKKEAEPKTKVEEPAPNGQLERVSPALFKKEAEPKTKIARRSDLKQ